MAGRAGAIGHKKAHVGARSTHLPIRWPRLRSSEVKSLVRRNGRLAVASPCFAGLGQVDHRKVALEGCSTLTQWKLSATFAALFRPSPARLLGGPSCNVPGFKWKNAKAPETAKSAGRDLLPF